MAVREYSMNVVFQKLLEGGYQVTVPLLPGLITYGRTMEEAREMAKDAIKCYLEALTKDHEPIPEGLATLQEKISVTIEL